MSEAVNREKLHESYSEKNGLKSILQIYKSKSFLRKNYARIPKWKGLLSAFLFLLLAAILSAAIIIIVQAPAASGHLESCLKKSCHKDINTKCVNNVCSCTADQYFDLKCVAKRSYGEPCWTENQCKDYLSCIDGTCQCENDYYNSNEKCFKRKSNQETCIGDQCLTSAFLVCDSSSKRCTCPRTRFWDGSICVVKRVYDERCLSTSHCNTDLLFVCINSKCVCEPTMTFFNTTTLECNNKKSEYEQCVSSVECLGSMTCVNGQCQCSTTKFYDPVTMKCVDRTKNNTACTTSNTCRVDLGLTCQSGFCQCNSTTFWHVASDKCISPMTYNNTGCTLDSHCIASKGLICNLNPTANPCNCPATSTTSMCDCIREKGNEYYWNGQQCVLAGVYSASCINNFNRSCQELTQLTFCRSGVCSLLLNGETCLSDIYCDYYRNLTCIDGTCQCEATYLYYDTTSQTCKPKKGEYVTCGSTLECLGTMTCTSGKCQCAFDAYFDASTLTCVPRTKNNTACTTSNTCRVDLGLTCQSGFCQCNTPTYFWHVTQENCILSMSYANTGCTADSNCLASKSLICNMNPTNNPCNCPTTSISGMCDCKRVVNSEFYWNGFTCVAAKSYGSSCTNTYECKSLTDYLTCLGGVCKLLSIDQSCTVSAQCDYNFYLSCSTTTGKCACMTGYYWDGTFCQPQVSYHVSCTSDAMCATGLCAAGLCICPTTQAYSFNQVKCVDCPTTGWFGYDDRCYITGGTATDWTTAKNNCAAKTTAAGQPVWLLVPSNDREFQMMTLKAAQTGTTSYWIGANSLSGCPWSVVAEILLTTITPTSCGMNKCLYMASGASNTGFCTAVFSYWCEWQPP